MLTPEEIKGRLKDRIASVVAEATDLHINTVRAFKKGNITNPSYEVIKKLSNYFEAQEAE